MNPTRDMAVWLYGLTEGAPESIQGAAAILGIVLAFGGLAVIAGIFAWAITKGEKR